MVRCRERAEWRSDPINAEERQKLWVVQFRVRMRSRWLPDCGLRSGKQLRSNKGRSVTSVSPSLSVSTLNQDSLHLVGQQCWPSHCPSDPSFQHLQQEALSTCSPNLRAACFLFPLNSPSADNNCH